MKTLHQIALGMMLLTTVISCKKNESNEPLTATVISNLSYGSQANQTVDVYLPAGRSEETPVILLVHGGGFVAGDKQDLATPAQQLSAQGFVVLNLNYRLVDIDGVLSNPMVHKPSAVKISDQLADISAVIAVAASHAGEWKMRTNRWAIAGHSAGATLALLYAYGDKNNDGRISAAGNWAGATTFAFTDESEVKLLDPRLVEVLYRAIGAEARNANKLAYMAASPYWVASQRGGVATINVRPEVNAVGDLPDGSRAEYQKFTDLLNAKSIPNKWVEVAGADHGFSKPGNWDTVTAETSAFFRARL